LGAVSYAEIRLSRPYKELKRRGVNGPQAKKLETGLKILSLATISSALILAAARIIFS
jgi:hypothetical protein